MNFKKILFITIISTFGNGLYADNSNKIFKDCNIEIQKFCSNSNKNIKKIQCLLENDSNLSDACKNGLKSHLNNLKNTGSTNCKEDVKKYCRWIIPGGGRIIKCLLSNENKLSLNCKNDLNKL